MKSHYESEADKEYHLHFQYTDLISIKAHFHKNIEMLFVSEGAVTVYVGGKKILLNAGEGLFVKPYEVHAYSDEKVQAWTLVISDRYFKNYRDEYCKNGVEKFPPTLLLDKNANMEILSILKQWKMRDSISRMEIHGWVNLVLSRITEYYPLEAYIRGKCDTFAIEALTYIDEHFTEDIDLDSLADKMGYSRNYCSSLFNKYVGENFNDYLNGLRVNKAVLLINEGNTVDFSINSVGFTNRATFYRAYNKLKSSDK